MLQTVERHKSTYQSIIQRIGNLCIKSDKMQSSLPVKSQTPKIVAACIIVPTVFTIIGISLIFPCSFGSPSVCKGYQNPPTTGSNCTQVPNGNGTILVCTPDDDKIETTTPLLTTAVEVDLVFMDLNGEIISEISEFFGQIKIFAGDVLKYSGHFRNNKKNGYGKSYWPGSSILIHLSF